MASEASTMATNPRVSINPRASSCMRLSLEVGRLRNGRRGVRSERNVFELWLRRGNDVLRDQLSHTVGGSGPGGDRRLDFGERSSYHHGDERIARDVIASESD